MLPCRDAKEVFPCVLARLVVGHVGAVEELRRVIKSLPFQILLGLGVSQQTTFCPQKAMLAGIHLFLLFTFLVFPHFLK